MKSCINKIMDTKAAQGWTIASECSGLVAPCNKNSNLYKALEETRKENPGKEIDYIVGGRAGRRWSEGYRMAVIIR